MADAIYNANSVGAAKGRPGGYAAVVDPSVDIKTLLDVKKTIKDLMTPARLSHLDISLRMALSFLLISLRRIRTTGEVTLLVPQFLSTQSLQR